MTITPFPHTAMVFAAGLGKRMLPLTETKPKPLIEVAGRTLVDRALDFLEASGIHRAIVNTAYKSEMVEAHLANRKKPEIIISKEPEPLETGGGILYALPLLGSGFIALMNSDIICMEGSGIKVLQRLHHMQAQTAADIVLLLHPVERATGYEGKGDFSLGQDGALIPRGDNAAAPYVFAGIQLINLELFRNCTEKKFSLSKLFRELIALESTGKRRIAGIVHEGEWLHVGDPQGLTQAEEKLKALA